MHELTAYATTVVTLGLAASRPRLHANLRISPAAAGALGMLTLLCLGLLRADHVTLSVVSLWRAFVAIA
ncbi:MAG: hypothetical protein ACT4TC_26040, partial [Myxococcaceae bacterium]